MFRIFPPHKRRFTRSVLGWVTLALLLLQGPLLGLVLCFEDNGHIAVETPHQRSTHTTLPSHAPCLDRPLLSAGRIESLSLVSSDASAYMLLAIPAARPPLLCTHRMLTANFFALLSYTPPPLQHTTILLI